MATITDHTTRASGTVLTANIYNSDHEVHEQNAKNLNSDKVEKPASATDNAIVRLDGASGAIQESGVTIDDSDNIAGVNNTTGVDANFVTGVAGANGNLVEWNTDGDAVDSGVPSSAGLTDISGLTPSDGNFIVGDGSNWVAESGNTARTSLGLGTGDSPQFSTVELGHASDTTLSRDASGEVAVEGSRLAKREVTANEQTGTSYTLALSDAGSVVEMNSGSVNTLTIPTNSSVAFPIGTIINVEQIGAGTTTISGDTGVTVNGVSAGSGDIGNQWGGVSLRKRATDEWTVVGNIGDVT